MTLMLDHHHKNVHKIHVSGLLLFLLFVEALSQYLAYEETLKLTQGLRHSTLHKLPLIFTDVTPPEGSVRKLHQLDTLTKGQNMSEQQEADSVPGAEGIEREVVSAKDGEVVGRGQAFLPVPFTTTFKSRVACVEVRIQVRE